MKTLSSGIILFAKKNPVLNGQFKEFYRLIDQFHRSDSKILALSIKISLTINGKVLKQHLLLGSDEFH